MDGHVLCTLPFTSYYIKIKKLRLIFSKQINTAENISSRLIWISVKENKKNISKLKQGGASTASSATTALHISLGEFWPGEKGNLLNTHYLHNISQSNRSYIHR